MKKQLILSVMAVAALATGSIFAAAEPKRIPLTVAARIVDPEGIESTFKNDTDVSMATARNTDAVARKAFRYVKGYHPFMDEADYNITVSPDLMSSTPYVHVSIRSKERGVKVESEKEEERFPADTAVWVTVPARVIERNADRTYKVRIKGGAENAVHFLNISPRQR